LNIRYIVGVYNKDDNTVVLRDAPFYNITRKVKSVESLKLPKFKLEKVKLKHLIIYFLKINVSLIKH